MLNRREFLTVSSLSGISLATLSGAGPALANSSSAEGLLHKDWFAQTSFDLRQDNLAARSEGKILTVLWEQRGCSYCRKMHDVVFAQNDIVSLIKDHFSIVQMDMWGEREFQSFDGEHRSEERIARSYYVRGTPSALFFDEAGEVVFQMPGYAEPTVFKAVFQYVKERGYNEKSFIDWYKSQTG